jgi:SAM-dependent methyltransferase
MRGGPENDGHPPAEPEVVLDLERQMGRLFRVVEDLTRLTRDMQDRLQAVEADLRLLRDSSGSGSDVGRWGGRFAALYPDFTDRFRGSTAEVSAKLQAYLPDVHRLVDSGGVVDLGCGRGEWLTLLRAAGVPARGVDADPGFVAAGRARGLDVELGDALGYLQSLPPNSVDLVTAFHLVEHLPTEDLLASLQAAKEALRPGGCLLLETPNPTNLVMAACDFYNDPTHRSPLPPALTEYLVSIEGFGDIEVRPLNPATPPPGLTGGEDCCAEVRALLVHMFFGPQDYAVLGYKLPAETR